MKTQKRPASTVGQSSSDTRNETRAPSRFETRFKQRTETRTVNRSEVPAERQSDSRAEHRSENRSDNRPEGRVYSQPKNRIDSRSENRSESRSEGRSVNRSGNRYENRPLNRADSPAQATTQSRPAQSIAARDPGINQFTGQPRKPARPPTRAQKGANNAPKKMYGDAPTTIMGRRLIQVHMVLDEVLTWEFAADSVVSHWLRAHPELGSRDRSEVAEAVFDVLRHLRKYRQLAEGGVGPATRRLAIQGLANTMGSTRVLEEVSPPEKDWLSRILLVDPDTLPAAVKYSLPDWLYVRLHDLPDFDALAHSLNTAAPLDIRVNPMKADRDEVLADLQKGQAVRNDPTPTPYSPFGIRLQGRPALHKWHQFEHGLIEVQDEGSQLLALLVGPKRGEMVIDFCAGAGGKTLLLGALMRSTGRLYAFDVSSSRLAKAKPRFARSGLSNVYPVVIEHENDTRVRRLAGKAHRVLVDAPCSGIGTLRRNPDLKWRQSEQSLAELTQLQARILDRASQCVAPGGRLVYATCSILEEENEGQVETFLAKHPDFEVVDASPILAARTPLVIEGPYLKLRPDIHETDGFFAVVFERKSTGENT